MTQTQTDPTIRRTLRAVALCGLLLSSGATWKYGVSEGLSVFWGSRLDFANLLVLQRTVAQLMAGVSAAWTGVAFLKFIVLFGATYFLIDSGAAEPLFLAIGFGALPLGVVLATMMAPFLFPPGSGSDGDVSSSATDTSDHFDSNEGQKNDSLHQRSGHRALGALSGSHGDFHA